MATRALITLSHGSRHPRASAGIQALSRAAAQRLGIADYACAYLEFDEPNLEVAACGLARRGVEKAVIVPLLFTEGYHQKVDVPAAVREAEEASGVQLLTTPGLGTGEALARVLAERMRGAHPGEHCIIYSVGSSDKCANIAVEKLAVRVADLTGHSTSVAFATRGGRETIVSQAEVYHDVRVLPLFVTEGLLLDLLADSPGTIEPPLGVDLAGIITARFQTAAGARDHQRQLIKNGI